MLFWCEFVCVGVFDQQLNLLGLSYGCCPLMFGVVRARGGLGGGAPNHNLT